MDPLPDRDSFLAQARGEPDWQVVPDADELGHLVGLCLWDTLSDNHDLILPDGSLRHLGSLRVTAGIIADFCNEWSPDAPDGDRVGPAGTMDYMDFYMGTALIAARTDLSPIYRYLFARFRALSYSWRFAWPRLRLVSFDRQELQGDQPEWQAYDPSEALERNREQAAREEQLARMSEDLDRLAREDLERARQLPPPCTVLAFRAVFGHWPSGWPPWA